MRKPKQKTVINLINVNETSSPNIAIKDLMVIELKIRYKYKLLLINLSKGIIQISFGKDPNLSSSGVRGGHFNISYGKLEQGPLAASFE